MSTPPLLFTASSQQHKWNQSSSDVLSTVNKIMKRNNNTVSPATVTPLATAWSPIAIVQSPMTTVPPPLATVSSPVATISSLATIHDEIEDIEEIEVSLNDKWARPVPVNNEWVGHEVLKGKHVWGEDTIDVDPVPLITCKELGVVSTNKHISSDDSKVGVAQNNELFHKVTHNTFIKETEMKKEVKQEVEVKKEQEMETEEEITQEELIEYQIFLDKLQSSSTGHVVAVGPAPSNQRSSYLKHNKSKVGVANIVSTATSTGSRGNKRKSKKKSPSRTNSINNSIQAMETIHVLPLHSESLPTNEILHESHLQTTESRPQTIESSPKPTKYCQQTTETCQQTTEFLPQTTKSHQKTTQSWPRTTESNSQITESNSQITESNSQITESNSQITESNSQITESNSHSTDIIIEEISENELLTDNKSDTAVNTHQQQQNNDQSIKDYTLSSPPPPLLRVQSTTSLNITADTFETKRKRTTPVYSIHCTSDTVLQPPCPLYGTVVQHNEYTSIKQSVNNTVKNETQKIQKNNENKMIENKENSSTFNQLLIHDSTSTSSSNDTSLHKAVREGNYREVEYLINKGYNVNDIDNEGCTPLMYCVLSNGSVQLTCADLLIRKGANIDQQANDGSTVLHESAIIGSLSLIELLLINGADPNIKDIDGRTPIHWCTANTSCCNKVLLLLLEASLCGIDVRDYIDMTPLMWACYNNNEIIVRSLLQLGADVYEKDIDGKTAAHWATSKCDINILQLLLTKDMTYFKDTSGRTVMHVAVSNGFIKGIQYILTLRPDCIQDVDKMGRTPLHYSSAINRVDICYMLLNKGGDATQTDNNNKTPLDYALIKQHEFVVALFTCHNTSIGDFTKQLHKVDSNQCIVKESISQTGLETNSLHGNEDCTDTSGSYLGLFTENDESPPLHYYFWITNNKLCWSRSINKNNKREAIVLDVIEEPSQMIKERKDYSPNDLHSYILTIITQDHGILDVLAYSETSYYYWLNILKDITTNNNNTLPCYSNNVI